MLKIKTIGPVNFSSNLQKSKFLVLFSFILTTVFGVDLSRPPAGKIYLN
jgi:hypothetical protein